MSGCVLNVRCGDIDDYCTLHDDDHPAFSSSFSSFFSSCSAATTVRFLGLLDAGGLSFAACGFFLFLAAAASARARFLSSCACVFAAAVCSTFALALASSSLIAGMMWG